jgi:hypothetical protein
LAGGSKAREAEAVPPVYTEAEVLVDLQRLLAQQRTSGPVPQCLPDAPVALCRPQGQRRAALPAHPSAHATPHRP